MSFDSIVNGALLYFALAFGGATVLLLLSQLAWRRLVDSGVSVLTLVCALPGVGAVAVLPDNSVILYCFAANLALFAMSSLVLKDFTMAGRALLFTHAGFVVVGAVWGLWFVTTIRVSPETRALMFAGFPLLVWFAVTGVIQNFEQWEVICRRLWHRPKSPLTPNAQNCDWKVSVHVAVCSEPPEIVMETLDSLASLSYQNFEILVVYNNTSDPALWKPIERYCRQLGDRFRFFCIEHLPGAKAGALNFALRETSPDVDVVAVVDSDDQAAPDFLERLIGYFNDPQIGFVQVAQDSRGWEKSLYLSMRHWAHKAFWLTTMVSRNERDGGLIAGTFALVRRIALEKAGGWAEWCLTEDSELAIRLHALGYSGVYVADTFGRGLIPARFSSLKRQYFRWTYGPVQELKRHFRLYLPWPLADPSELSTAQKVHHLNHGVERLNLALRMLLIPLGASLMLSMTLNREVIDVPEALSTSALVFLLAGVIYWYLVYRVIVGASLGQMLAALFVSRAISHTTGVASAAALVTQNTSWRRTEKSRGRSVGLAAVWQARTELLLGIGCIVFGMAVFLALPQAGLLLFFVIGSLDQALTYLAAPALALVADRSLT